MPETNTTWQQSYTPEQLAIIDKHWKGAPPKECTGACKHEAHYLGTICKVCSWIDDIHYCGGASAMEYEP